MLHNYGTAVCDPMIIDWIIGEPPESAMRRCLGQRFLLRIAPQRLLVDGPRIRRCLSTSRRHRAACCVCTPRAARHKSPLPINVGRLPFDECPLFVPECMNLTISRSADVTHI